MCSRIYGEVANVHKNRMRTGNKVIDENLIWEVFIMHSGNHGRKQRSEAMVCGVGFPDNV